MKVAVIGGGWAGLAAAVEATALEHQVTLFEMAGTAGGRARDVSSGVATSVAPGAERDPSALLLDNGQHILIGAYAETLRLMRTVGVDVDAALMRTPLRVTYPDGSGLVLEAGAPVPAFVKAVLGYRGWRWSERASMLGAAVGWSLRGFRCDASLTVAQITARLPEAVRTEFIDPLCVAALNTPSAAASASVFLRVLKDALFSGPGSADLLLPRVGLGSLLPAPASAWLVEHGAVMRLGSRVMSIRRGGPDDTSPWAVDDELFDAVIVACSATEAARLVMPISPSWSSLAERLEYEPIVTVYVQTDDRRLPSPMMALRSDASSPAQFVFDHGRLRGRVGLMAMVVSGATDWLASGLDGIGDAAVAQLRGQVLSKRCGDVKVVKVISEKRATFLCTPGLERPWALIARRLACAGDHVAGPYPATLEGAVRSGLAAARLVCSGAA